MLLTLGTAWNYFVVSFEPLLGDDSSAIVKDLNGVHSNDIQQESVPLSFAEGGKALSWT